MLIGDAKGHNDVLVLDIETNEVVSRLRGHEQPVWAVAFLPEALARADRIRRYRDAHPEFTLERPIA